MGGERNERSRRYFRGVENREREGGGRDKDNTLL